MEIGTNVAGKMVSALKRLGFDKVFDTNTGADFTIMEEASELIERLEKKDHLPMITSCSPGWVKYIEMNYPELLPHLSSCKSPHQMFGAILKTYFAEKEGIDPRKIYVVSVMPCIAKKFERGRPEMKEDGLYDVDNVITTRELSRMIKQANIEFTKLGDTAFDNPMGEATGAAAIFGTTGGVMEAALRTAQDVLTGEDLEKIDFKQVRGEEGIKRATVNIAGNDLNVVAASGLSNARQILEEIRTIESASVNLGFSKAVITEEPEFLKEDYSSLYGRSRYFQIDKIMRKDEYIPTIDIMNRYAAVIERNAMAAGNYLHDLGKALGLWVSLELSPAEKNGKVRYL